MPNDPTELRLALKRAGYAPIPLNGKAPVLPDWPHMLDTPDAVIAGWANGNTGLLAKFTPRRVAVCAEMQQQLQSKRKGPARWSSGALDHVMSQEGPSGGNIGEAATAVKDALAIGVRHG
jgi:hypothetical protein